MRSAVIPLCAVGLDRPQQQSPRSFVVGLEEDQTHRLDSPFVVS
jgi:hypothetical protein